MKRLAIALCSMTLILAGALPQTACARTPAPQGPATAGASGEEKKAAMEEIDPRRDELYRETLTSLERLEAVWKQQPGNSAALVRSVADLRERLGELRALAGEDEPEPSREGTASEGTAASPSGPVGPSAEPTPEDEARRREEATLGRFRSAGPPLGRPQTLAGVADARIADSCDRADARLDELDRLLEGAATDRGAFSAALAELGDLLAGMSEPPPEKPPETRPPESPGPAAPK